MPSTVSMEFDKDQFSVPGKVPVFGAIFISNSATKKECFRRKLLGLPMGQAHFVKQVKAGMILFLFEYERRELHGVFQACSDGAMNIVPHAYSSSGKQFPAQVKFTQIWHCSPLSENEFRDAIRENYFSANKFNFGLSEIQVQKLLLLFSLRKLKDKSCQRQFRQGKVARPIRYSTNKARSAVDNGSFIMIDSELREKDEQNADGSFGSVISTKYAGNSISNHGRITDDDRFAHATVENGHKMDSEFGLFTSNELAGDSLGKVGRLVDDGRFEANKGPFVSTENSHEMDSEYGLFTSNDDGQFVANKGPFVSTENSHEMDSEYGLFTSNDDGQFVASKEPFVMTESDHQMDSEFGRFTSNELPGHPLGEVGRLVDDGRLVGSKGPFASTENGHKIDSEYGRFKSNDDGRFAGSKGPFVLTGSGHKMDSEFGRFISNELPRDPFGKVGRLVDDGWFVASKGPFVWTENGHKMDSEFGQFTSNELPGDPFGKVGRFVDDGWFVASKGPFVWTENGHKMDSEFGQFTSNELPGDHFGKVGRLVDDGQFLASKGPFVSTESGHKMDSEFGRFISNELLGDSLGKVGRLVDDGQFVESKGPFVSTEYRGAFLSNLPASSGKPSLEANFFINNQFQQASMVRRSVEQQNSSLSSSTTSKSYRDGGVMRTIPYDLDVPTLNCRRSASLATSIPAVPYDPDVPCLNSRPSASLAANVPVLKEGNTRSIDYHGHTSISQDIYQNSERMCSDYQKGRKSVFSRICLPPEICEQDNGSNVGNDIDSSVDEIMAILHKNHYQWVKEKNFKQPIKRHDEVANFWNKKQTTSNSKLLKDHLPRVSNEMNMAVIPAGEENGVQKAEEMPFLDFKRRSKVRKTQDDANSREHTENAENVGSSGGQHKRRKLIRPKFSGNESSGDVMVGSQDNERQVCQSVELPDEMFHINHVDKNTDAERGSKCGGVERRGSCEPSFRNTDEDRKDASQDVGIQNMPFSVFCEDETNAKEGLSFKNSEVDGLSQHHSSSIYTHLQESFPELCREKAVACGGLDHDGGNEKFFHIVEIVDQSRPLSSEIAIGSRNQNSESEKVSEELGNVEGNKQRLASLETVCNLSRGNMKESSQEICEGNDRCEEVLAPSAGRGHKMDFEQDTGNGNHASTCHCEIAKGSCVSSHEARV